MTALIGAIRNLPCGCVKQYAMWEANVLSWATVRPCKRHA